MNKDELFDELQSLLDELNALYPDVWIQPSLVLKVHPEDGLPKYRVTSKLSQIHYHVQYGERLTALLIGFVSAFAFHTDYQSPIFEDDPVLPGVSSRGQVHLFAEALWKLYEVDFRDRVPKEHSAKMDRVFSDMQRDAEKALITDDSVLCKKRARKDPLWEVQKEGNQIAVFMTKKAFQQLEGFQRLPSWSWMQPFLEEATPIHSKIRVLVPEDKLSLFDRFVYAAYEQAHNASFAEKKAVRRLQTALYEYRKGYLWSARGAQYSSKTGWGSGTRKKR